MVPGTCKCIHTITDYTQDWHKAMIYIRLKLSGVKYEGTLKVREIVLCQFCKGETIDFSRRSAFVILVFTWAFSYRYSTTVFDFVN